MKTWSLIAAVLLMTTVTVAQARDIETPPGVTVQQTVAGSVFADDQGRTLYMPGADRGAGEGCKR